MDGTHLREILVDRPGHGSVIGNVYLGRVERVLSGIAAAFVDIGLGRSGFLGLAEARPPGHAGDEAAGVPADRISDYVTEGDAVLVQVQRDPAPDKGAKLTTHVTLTGRRSILMPGSEEVRLSRRIEGAEERARLSDILRDAAQPGEGFILRTAGAGAVAETLHADIARLRRIWTEILECRAGARPPLCLYREPGIARRILRDEAGADVREIVVEGAGALADLRAYCAEMTPELVNKLTGHEGGEPILEAFGVEEQIDRALAARVELPSGGSLIIGETAALIAIDVNTGGRSDGGGPEETALQSNLEAADEIARQLRLRNLAGLLVVDFVPMRKRHNNAEVLARLRAGVGDDRIPTHVFGQTKLGLFEMTRQRRSESLAELMGAPCPACAGSGWVRGPLSLAFDGLRRVLRAAAAAPGAGVELIAAPAVVAVLKGPAAEALAETEAKLGGRLKLTADERCAPDRIEVLAHRRGRDADG